MRRYRRNADTRLREGIRIFLSGGASELPGEVLVKIRATADAALLEDGHTPVRGGPIAPEGWVWVELEGAQEDLYEGGMTGWDVWRFRENPRSLFDPRMWCLVGPWEDVYLEFNEAELTGHMDFSAWALVPRAPNEGRAGELCE